MLLKLIVTANYWCNANKLQINPEKSTTIIFLPKLNLPRPEVNFIYNTSNTSSISLCDSAKYLGVTIDSTLNFKPHIYQSINQSIKQVYFMRTRKVPTGKNISEKRVALEKRLDIALKNV